MKNLIKRSSIVFTLGLIFLSHSSFAGDHHQCVGPNRVTRQLEIFDDLDFNVYSNQRWDELKKSHADNILVHYPDGSTTQGLEAHIEKLKFMFTFAPDTKITAHPVKFGQEYWTSVIGELEGTFSKPMILGPNQVIQPTGKRVKLQMVTVGKWNKNCVMDEEWLFWDNAAYMNQIGLGQ